ncbi:hypothetical protein SLEP1_g49460 [Rubroshorea leprosula]|uniref:HAT C-terminal dimerisation domain-containing protein n=1 Tax=Rubroshorea leprosula TaxID=152421 RepID=A0AAV5LXU8_9ROSI|nr:hypothetical protein SLEP1_g49460 [Rubroshorea leprosula]
MTYRGDVYFVPVLYPFCMIAHEVKPRTGKPREVMMHGVCRASNLSLGRDNLARDLKDENEDIDVLQWWKMNEYRFLVVATMARDVLVVPISTVAYELAFSIGDRILDAFQSSLTPRMAQALICAQDWLKDKAISNMEEDLDKLDSLEKEFDKLHLDSTILE